ncbi:hypothetical protein E2C01_019466 [Portunus trituberculatus]|uniref:Uncharacterized protein n=1 Tax=Portunus trituberculatus TaxID=210409 RepID=A0A5B7DXA2_PORTR|nr:hypothetical protein [Portunus trituberculatus]
MDSGDAITSSNISQQDSNRKTYTCIKSNPAPNTAEEKEKTRLQTLRNNSVGGALYGSVIVSLHFNAYGGGGGGGGVGGRGAAGGGGWRCGGAGLGWAGHSPLTRLPISRRHADGLWPHVVVCGVGVASHAFHTVLVAPPARHYSLNHRT